VARPAKLLLVDNHALFRAGLKTALAEWEDVEVVAEAGDGLEAVTRVKELRPDLVIMDIDLPRCNGLKATRLIKAFEPDINIVLLTYPHMGDQVFFEAIRSGARNFIPRNADISLLLHSLRRVLKGENVVPDHLVNELVNQIVMLEKAHSNYFRAVSSITPREEEVLQHLAQGFSDEEIAAILNVTERTVLNYVNRILSKLGIGDRSQAVSRAMEMGLSIRQVE
jgi:DNA-binding NarL/FixJ family response regulator